jgi:hypothetical protein
LNAALLLRLARRLPTGRQIEAPLRAFTAFTTVLLLCATVLHREDADGFQASHLFFMPRRTWEMDHGRGMMYERAYYERMDMEVLAEEVYGDYGYAERDVEREVEVPAAAEPHEPAGPDPSSTTAYRDWLAAQHDSYTRWFAANKGQYADWLQTEGESLAQWLAEQPPEYRDAYERELDGVDYDGVATTETDGDEGDSLWPGRQTQGQTVRRAPHAPAAGGTTLPIMGAANALEAPGWLFEPAALPNRAPACREDDTPSPPPRRVYPV